jgi:CO dehydrogenase/acetyl-CoA synthase beta subunit
VEEEEEEEEEEEKRREEEGEKKTVKTAFAPSLRVVNATGRYVPGFLVGLA